MPLPMRLAARIGGSPPCFPVLVRPCTATPHDIRQRCFLPSRSPSIPSAVNSSSSSNNNSSGGGSSSVRAANGRRGFASEVKCRSSTPDAAAMPPHKDETFLEAVQNAYGRFTGLAGKFMPMVCLFFFLSFVNTILDSLKDTLVITASGGGAQVIPYLTVYAVLPSSVVFLVAYSFASQRLTRGQLFNAIIAVFISFFAAFAFIMYPNHESLHPHGMADALSKVLPSGVEGLVGMIRNWTFTLFFCISELWGDVCLGLLFWGLANDITSLTDAGLMYPLFGLGANLAQALAGSVLKFFSNGAGTGGAASFCREVQGLMCVVMLFSAAALTLHSVIDRSHRRALLREKQEKKAEQKRLKEKLKAEGFSTEQLQLRLEVHAALQGEQGEVSSSGSEDDDDAQQAPLRDRQASHSSASPGPSSASQPVPASSANGTGSSSSSSSSSSSNHNSSSSNSSSSNSSSSSSNGTDGDAGAPAVAATTAAAAAAPTDEGQQKQQGKKGKRQRKPKASVMEIFGVLAASTPIRCLTIMSLAQGLCTNLMEFAWKSHIGLLFPGPKEFTAFMGEWQRRCQCCSGSGGGQRHGRPHAAWPRVWRRLAVRVLQIRQVQPVQASRRD
ncbi:TLC ATP/ADP transporter-domain-containing protein, partial [Dunaliella salina]